MRVPVAPPSSSWNAKKKQGEEEDNIPAWKKKLKATAATTATPAVPAWKQKLKASGTAATTTDDGAPVPPWKAKLAVSAGAGTSPGATGSSSTPSWKARNSTETTPGTTSVTPTSSKTPPWKAKLGGGVSGVEAWKAKMHQEGATGAHVEEAEPKKEPEPEPKPIKIVIPKKKVEPEPEPEPEKVVEEVKVEEEATPKEEEKEEAPANSKMDASAESNASTEYDSDDSDDSSGFDFDAAGDSSDSDSDDDDKKKKAAKTPEVEPILPQNELDFDKRIRNFSIYSAKLKGDDGDAPASEETSIFLRNTKEEAPKPAAKVEEEDEEDEINDGLFAMSSGVDTAALELARMKMQQQLASIEDDLDNATEEIEEEEESFLFKPPSSLLADEPKVDYREMLQRTNTRKNILLEKTGGYVAENEEDMTMLDDLEASISSGLGGSTSNIGNKDDAPELFCPKLDDLDLFDDAKGGISLEDLALDDVEEKGEELPTEESWMFEVNDDDFPDVDYATLLTKLGETDEDDDMTVEELNIAVPQFDVEQLQKEAAKMAKLADEFDNAMDAAQEDMENDDLEFSFEAKRSAEEGSKFKRRLTETIQTKVEYDADNDEELEAKHRSLMVLMHGAKCKSRPGLKCAYPFCKPSKVMMMHITTCKDRKCTTGYCPSSKYVLRHAKQICMAMAKKAQARAALRPPPPPAPEKTKPVESSQPSCGISGKSLGALSEDEKEDEDEESSSEEEEEEESDDESDAPKKVSKAAAKKQAKKQVVEEESSSEEEESEDESDAPKKVSKAKSKKQVVEEESSSEEEESDDESDAPKKVSKAASKKQAKKQVVEEESSGEEEESDDESDAPKKVSKAKSKKQAKKQVVEEESSSEEEESDDESDAPKKVSKAKSKKQVVEEESSSEEEEESDDESDAPKKVSKAASKKQAKKQVVEEESSGEEEESDDESDAPKKVFKAKSKKQAKKQVVEEESSSEEEESDDEPDVPKKVSKATVKKQLATKKIVGKEEDDDEDEESDDEPEAPKKVSKATAKKQLAAKKIVDKEEDDEESESEEDTESEAIPPPPPPTSSVTANEEDESESENEDVSTKPRDSKANVPPPPPTSSAPRASAASKVSTTPVQWDIEYSDDESDEESQEPTGGASATEVKMGAMAMKNVDDDEDGDGELPVPNPDTPAKEAATNEDDDDSDDEEEGGVKPLNNVNSGIVSSDGMPKEKQVEEGSSSEVKQTEKWEIDYSDDEDSEVEGGSASERGENRRSSKNEGVVEVGQGVSEEDVRAAGGDEEEMTKNTGAAPEVENTAANVVKQAANSLVEHCETKEADTDTESKTEDARVGQSEAEGGSTESKLESATVETQKPDGSGKGLDSAAKDATDDPVFDKGSEEDKVGADDDTTAEESQDEDSRDGAPDASVAINKSNIETAPIQAMEGILHQNILFQKSYGVVALTATELCFQADGSPPSDCLRVAWTRVTKQQASPPTHPKVLLKVVLSDGDGLTFQLESRAAMECLRKDIAEKLNSGENENVEAPSNKVQVETPLPGSEQTKNQAVVNSPPFAIFKPVEFKGCSGSLVLTMDRLSFEPNESGNVPVTCEPVAWNDIAKHQGSPPKIPKAMLKISLKNGKSMTFALPDRVSLEKLQKDIASQLRSDGFNDVTAGEYTAGEASMKQLKNSLPSTASDRQSETSSGQSVTEPGQNTGADSQIDVVASFPRVIFETKTGSMSLSTSRLLFSPEDDNGPKLPVPLSDILKFQASPPKHSKALLRLVLRSKKTLTFQLENQSELIRLRDDLAVHWKSAKESVSGENESSLHQSSVSSALWKSGATGTNSSKGVSLEDSRFSTHGPDKLIDSSLHKSSLTQDTTADEKAVVEQEEVLAPHTVHQNVGFRKSIGALSLSTSGLHFQAKGAPQKDAFHVPWNLVVKQQASPPAHPKPLLKIVLSQGKPITLHLKTRQELEHVRDDIAIELKNLSVNEGQLNNPTPTNDREHDESNSSKNGSTGTFTNAENRDDSGSAIYGPVKYQSMTGSLHLSGKQLIFESDGDNVGSIKAGPIDLQEVAKCQAAPPKTGKTMLKVVLNDGQNMIFHMKERSELMKLQKDISSRRSLQSDGTKEEQQVANVVIEKEASKDATTQQSGLVSSSSPAAPDKTIPAENGESGSTIYGPVKFKSMTGSLHLNGKTLTFKPAQNSGSDDSKVIPVDLQEVTKCQAAPPKTGKAMLKLVLNNGENLVFLLKDREELMELQKDISCRQSSSAQTEAPPSRPRQSERSENETFIEQSIEASPPTKADTPIEKAPATEHGSAAFVEKEYEPVKYGADFGKLLLKRDHLCFIPSRDEAQQTVFAFVQITDHRASPPEKTKAALKILFVDGASATFQLKTRTALDELCGDVKTRLEVTEEFKTNNAATEKGKISCQEDKEQPESVSKPQELQPNLNTRAESTVEIVSTTGEIEEKAVIANAKEASTVNIEEIEPTRQGHDVLEVARVYMKAYDAGDEVARLRAMKLAKQAKRNKKRASSVLPQQQT